MHSLLWWLPVLSGVSAIPAKFEQKFDAASDNIVARQAAPLAPTPPNTNAVTGAVYLGYYLDLNPATAALGGLQSNVQHLLTGPSVTSPKVTWAACTAYCAAYQFAGISGGSTCQCGNSFAYTPIRALDAICNLTCLGNAGQCCGAVNRLVLFRNLNYNPPTAPTPPPAGQPAAGRPSSPVGGLLSGLTGSLPALPSAGQASSPVGGLLSGLTGSLPALPSAGQASSPVGGLLSGLTGGKLPSLPAGLPNLPLNGLPSLPAAGLLSGLPALPNTASLLPAAGLPSLPGLPKLPSLPAGLPNLPLNGLPSLPAAGLLSGLAPLSNPAGLLPAVGLPSLPLGQPPAGGASGNLPAAVGRTISSTATCLQQLAPAVRQQVLNACF